VIGQFTLTTSFSPEMPDRRTWDLPSSDAGSTIKCAGGICVYAQRFSR